MNKTLLAAIAAALVASGSATPAFADKEKGRKFLSGSPGVIYQLGKINLRAARELGWELGRYSILRDPATAPFDPGRYPGPYWWQR